jgi:PAS domain S-box-containing protein
MNKTSSVAAKSNGYPRRASGLVPVIEPLPRSATEHFVQFYDRDESLVSSVTQFLRDGFEDEESAIIICTNDHARAIELLLETVGVDVVGLKKAGTFVTLDAAKTLASFMIGDLPDAALFQRAIGSRVAHALTSGRRLRLFGEMVSLLWNEGKTDAMMRLEELWNELGRHHIFRLFCAYPMNSFARHSCDAAFTHICNAHTRVLPSEAFDAAADGSDERLRAVAILQQKASAFAAEVEQRRLVETELRHNKNELASFVENAVFGLHSAAPDGTILWANDAELAMLGYDRDEYFGHHIAEFYADREVIDDVLTRLARGETIRDHEVRLKCKDGSIKIALIDASVLWDNDRFVHTQCFTRDVTAQREAEQHSRRLAAIVESSDDAIISKTLDGTITSWNQGAERTFGYTAEEAIGRNIRMLIPAERQDEEPAIVSRVGRGERIDHYDTIRQRKDGTRIEISLSVSPLKDAHGRIVGVSKIARDITERKRSEELVRSVREELTRVNAELERRVQERTAALAEAVAQMEEFSYTVSHDLRAPLRGMQVYSQALLEDYGPTLNDEARHCLERIAENATRLDKMVLDVLTFSRVSRTEIRLERVSLDRLARSLVLHYPEMQPPRAQIIIEPLADVVGHEPSLTQAISNLLTNAVKFVGPGVTPTVHLRTERRGGNVRLWVEDNGIGINPAHQSRLFRMFERVHPSLPYDGTGVGLAIVRKALTRMGGDAGVESDGANGSRFWIELPEPPPIP